MRINSMSGTPMQNCKMFVMKVVAAARWIKCLPNLFAVQCIGHQTFKRYCNSVEVRLTLSWLKYMQPDILSR